MSSKNQFIFQNLIIYTKLTVPHMSITDHSKSTGSDDGSFVNVDNDNTNGFDEVCCCNKLIIFIFRFMLTLSGNHIFF